MCKIYAGLKTQINEKVAECLDMLKQGNLDEENLRQISKLVSGVGTYRQDILYLQATTSSPSSTVIGMRMIEDGEIYDGPSDYEDWPYKTVLEAIRDGWGIIKLPETALSLDENRTYGLGYEFVLERYS